MQNTYNLYNLEASFKEYLLAGNTQPVSVKNYLSDYRHFVGWISLYVRSNDLKNISLPNLITEATIKEYKSYLLENNIPFKTINRRLSTVRKFCSFCIAQGCMKENPGKQIQNSNLKSPALQSNVSEEILNQYEQDLLKQNLNQSVIKSFLDDVREFLAV